LLSFALYLVVAQLITPFSIYAVEIIGMSETELGYLFALNGFLVAVAQIMVTRMLRKTRFTTQLAVGALIYFIGYGSLGLSSAYGYLVVIMIVVTSGEMIMSPPSLTLASRLSPPDKLGRYMGVYTFFTMTGWSLGPLYGGWFLDNFKTQPQLAWLMIASIALVASLGFFWFGRRLDDATDR
jgi:MFS family permease